MVETWIDVDVFSHNPMSSFWHISSTTKKYLKYVVLLPERVKQWLALKLVLWEGIQAFRDKCNLYSLHVYIVINFILPLYI
mgnify:CR=1 FL=1